MVSFFFECGRKKTLMFGVGFPLSFKTGITGIQEKRKEHVSDKSLSYEHGPFYYLKAVDTIKSIMHYQKTLLRSQFYNFFPFTYYYKLKV